MKLYNVNISDDIWMNGKNYEILSYKPYTGSDYAIRRAILPALKADGFFYGFFYGMKSKFIFDLDDTYPITDEKFIDIPQILRQLIRDDKLNSLYL